LGWGGDIIIGFPEVNPKPIAGCRQGPRKKGKRKKVKNEKKHQTSAKGASGCSGTGKLKSVHLRSWTEKGNLRKEFVKKPGHTRGVTGKVDPRSDVLYRWGSTRAHTRGKRQTGTPCVSSPNTSGQGVSGIFVSQVGRGGLEFRCTDQKKGENWNQPKVG